MQSFLSSRTGCFFCPGLTMHPQHISTCIKSPINCNEMWLLSMFSIPKPCGDMNSIQHMCVQSNLQGSIANTKWTRRMYVSHYKPQEFSVLKIQFNFDISNINISNTINISKWVWVKNHSFFVHLYHRYLYLKFLRVSNTFLSSNEFYIMGFRCIPAIPVSLNSQQQSFNIYIYSG